MKLSKKDVQILINKWGIGDLISYERSTKGESNHNWIVKTTQGKFILRCAPNFRKLKDLKFELDYLTTLNKTGFPYKIPTPLPNNKGHMLISYKKGRWWLYEFIAGEIIEPVPISLMSQLGKMIALYHNIIKRLDLSNGKKSTLPFNRPAILKELTEFKKKTLAIKRKEEKHHIFLEEAEKLIALLNSLDARDYSNFPQYPIHRDFNPENILWHNDKIVGVIDFENVGVMKDILISDIIFSTMMAATTEEEHKLDLDKFEAFINEYQKYNKLSTDELELIPEMFVSAWIEAFSWQYWLQLNDPTRAQLHRLRLYANAAQWHFENREKILKTIFP